MSADELPDDPRGEWVDEAACLGHPDPEVFHDGHKTPEAREVCADCPVIQQCMDYALSLGDVWGTWGGVYFRNGKPNKNKKENAA